MSRPSDDDPVARRSDAACRFFARVMRRELSRHFRAVRIARPGLPALAENRPVMICANHPSWWDPAMFIALHPELFPKREGFGPIDAAMLERYRFMARIGAFGVRQDDARGGADFLRTARALMTVPRRVLWITAQGRFADPRTRPLDLRPGAAHLLARAPQLVAVPLALEYPFWGEKRPEALALFGRAIEARPGERPAEIADRLEAGLTEAADHLAGLSMARDPSAFRAVIGGARGVGGVYGLWQRGRAALDGRTHAPDHVPDPTPDPAPDPAKEN
ncbi:lysophospholipid acyltransferase family protein [Limimaricola pyoseonensis]|uniref:1-acyl-sn-glycerol-3-phosphate acyltransferase n=1 Tax=Limimaricola pyoseonensis TaxID=521013 RepID=A0A1G7FW41_9RHOB|nr:lysophospholipid acyltransferase family protein [Limimaricola pyoseonensis]SDE80099.1 1-acyl-sn-glycerol-3-phosphate acyltransferase [Limimaricola pyoseonensis]